MSLDRTEAPQPLRGPHGPHGSQGAVLMIEVGGRGGVADYTEALIGALTEEGFPCELATATDHLLRVPPSVPVHPVVPWLRATSSWARLIRAAGLGPAANAGLYVAALPRLLRIARRSGVVHLQGTYFPPLFALTAMLLRLLRVPLVHTRHTTFDRGRSHRLSHWLIAGCAARTVVHARADVSRLPGPARGGAVVIPHGEYGTLARTGGDADPAEARHQLGLQDEDCVVLVFGQLRADKGIRDILEAATRVPSVRALLAGEELGGLSDARDALAALEAEGRVVVREGFHGMAEAARFFAAADVVALPYHQASQSGVLLLAYGFRRPVIVYPVGGLTEAVLEGETGWICDRADPEALAERLRDVAAAGREECRRRGAAGERLAATRYGWEGIARTTIAAYRAARQGP